jgi:hypothetical protein
MEMPIMLPFYWQLFTLMTMVPFACFYVFALAMPGRRSLSCVVLLAAAITTGFLIDWWQGQYTFIYISTRDVYKWHLAILPILIGLVGGTALRVYQLYNGHRRIGWTTAVLFVAGLAIPPVRVFDRMELFGGGL